MVLTSEIIRHNTRILRPNEYKLLISKGIDKREYQVFFNALLFTGMRYIEMQRFQKHPEWFDGNFINLPKIAVKKAKRKQLERSVRLTPLGRQLIPFFLDIKRPLPSWQSWQENLKRWADKADIGNKGMGVKTTRKTWESWLMFYYPYRQFEIALSQGHTSLVSLRYYLNMPFTEHDKMEMKEFVEGW